MTAAAFDAGEMTVANANALSVGNFHGTLGFEVTHVAAGEITATLGVRGELLNPAGGLHGGVITGFADSLCGYGVFSSLPRGAEGFVTLDLQANLLGPARLDDTITGTAKLRRGGHTIQVWNVTIANGERDIADVTVTQMLRYPQL